MRSDPSCLFAGLQSIPSSAHAELRDIAVACWDADKAKRPTFPRLLEQLQKLKERGPPKISLTLGVDAHKYQKGKVRRGRCPLSF